MTLNFTVYGVARPKGNHRAFMRPGMKFPVITDSNRNAKSWAQLIAQRANEAITALPAAEREICHDGVRLTVAFYLPRPKALSKRGFEPPHLTKPDIDKLLRSVCDALSAVAWHDDAQVVEVIAAKRYAHVNTVPHVDISVAPSTGAILLHHEPSLFAER